MDRTASAARDMASINRLFNQEAGHGLSERGRREAEQVAGLFEMDRPAALYASPLARARETAEVTAARLGMDVRVREELVELRTGHLPERSLAGRAIGRVARAERVPLGVRRAVLGGTLIPLYYASWRRGLTEGGESQPELRARLDRILDELSASHRPDATVALFCHGYLIFHLTQRIARRRDRLAVLRRPYIHNGAVTETRLAADGRHVLVRYAETRHLRR